MHQCGPHVVRHMFRSAVGQQCVRVAPSLTTVPCRGTHILKHFEVPKYQTALPEQAPNPQVVHKLTDYRFVYENVRYEAMLKKKPLDVLLLVTVEGLGKQGAVVSVPPGKARRNLLLPRLAVYASPENRKKYAHLQFEDSEDMPSSMFATKTVATLGGICLPVTMNVREAWLLEPWHVSVSFRVAGYHVPEECIELPDKPIAGPNLEYEDKFFYVTVTVNKREKVRVRCLLNHVSGLPEYRLPYKSTDVMHEPPEAIIPEDQAYLTALFHQRKFHTRCREPQLTPEMVAKGITSTEKSNTE